ncbi:XTP/dITP diphosphohydrolase [Balneicella halophila]|uniref:dITP/XTP pyrophosphatase n=1 Tax=Balneicella halophila TaxID=1537566 RepID=A0A7L4URT7_BALHA|nr:non-canonical purine NTP diphosphatase [Balneicella halophila]PVX52212.1 XTP/dITP diphosphohydrolase [Balneicella halophila]
MELIIATNNSHKVEEIKEILPANIDVKSLREIGIVEEIPETQDTLEGNALQKARYIYDKYSKNCFADDTGLEVEALDNAPGVYSARYAGDDCSFEDNIQKLLRELKGIENRKARFRTVVALIIDGHEHLFEGEVTGKILESKQGNEGFGYDPVFLPDGYEDSFATMASSEKNKISHRGKAVRALASFLRKTL